VGGDLPRQQIFTVPGELFKILLQTRTAPAAASSSTSGSASASGAPLSLAAVVRAKIGGPRGLLGLYDGAAAALARDIPFSMCYFTLYGLGKRWLQRTYHTAPPASPAQSQTQSQAAGQGLAWYERLTASTAAGVVAAVIATPCDVIKTRIQRQPDHYTGVVQAAARILKEESPTAFMKGQTTHSGAPHSTAQHMYLIGRARRDVCRAADVYHALCRCGPARADHRPALWHCNGCVRVAVRRIPRRAAASFAA
jgi:hypothetical protein